MTSFLYFISTRIMLFRCTNIFNRREISKIVSFSSNLFFSSRHNQIFPTLAYRRAHHLFIRCNKESAPLFVITYVPSMPDVNRTCINKHSTYLYKVPSVSPIVKFRGRGKLPYIFCNFCTRLFKNDEQKCEK